MDILFQITGFLLALSVHEAAHAFVAFRCGDHTAFYQGRVSLNPLAHIDLFGTVIIPLLLILSRAGFVIGWAKPVPVNPYNFRKPRRDSALVALAGPLANFLTAALVLILLRFIIGDSIELTSTLRFFINLFITVAGINLVLGIFNLIPIPPLDGSHILESLLNPEARFRYLQIFSFPFGMIFIVLLINLPFFQVFLRAVIGFFVRFFLQ